LFTATIFGGAVEFEIREMRGVKVGFFGLLTPDTAQLMGIENPMDAGQRIVGGVAECGADQRSPARTGM